MAASTILECPYCGGEYDTRTDLPDLYYSTSRVRSCGHCGRSFMTVVNISVETVTPSEYERREAQEAHAAQEPAE